MPQAEGSQPRAPEQPTQEPREDNAQKLDVAGLLEFLLGRISDLASIAKGGGSVLDAAQLVAGGLGISSIVDGEKALEIELLEDVSNGAGLAFTLTTSAAAGAASLSLGTAASAFGVLSGAYSLTERALKDTYLGGQFGDDVGDYLYR